MQGKETLLDAVVRCWASLWTARAITYRLKQNIVPDEVSLAVVVQKQIESEVSGVAFSLNPNNNDYDEAVINSNFGLGESVVSGQVTPDSFVVNKVTNQIIEKQLASKEYVLVSKDGGGMEKSTLADPNAASLTDAQVIAVTALVTKVEAHYKLPMDIEWGLCRWRALPPASASDYDLCAAARNDDYQTRRRKVSLHGSDRPDAGISGLTFGLGERNLGQDAGSHQRGCRHV